jgi:Mg-chelatase subunit ChlD
MARVTAVFIAAGILAATGVGPGVLRAQLQPDLARVAPAAETDCGAAITRAVAPRQVRLCERAGVTVALHPACPAKPLYVVFIQGLIAESTVAEPLQRKYARAAIDGLDLGHNPQVRVADVWMEKNKASIVLPFTNDEHQVRDKLLGAPLRPGDANPRQQCFPCGFKAALQAMADSQKLEKRAVEAARKVIVVMTIPPYPDLEYREWEQSAGRAKGQIGRLVLACNFFKSSCEYTDWGREANPGYYFEGDETGRLEAAMQGMVRQTTLKNLAAVSVDDEWPTGLDLVPDSVVPPPAALDTTNRRLRWDFTAPITQALTLTYQVQPLAMGAHQFVGGRTVITDTAHRTRLLPLPTGVLTVTGPCETPTFTPSPEPTPTFTATPGPTATWTAVATATGTPTPTATATRHPAPVYLPLALREQCVPGQKRVDVALAIDASTSMLLPADAAHTKLAVAVDAAREFLDLLHMDAGDQAAVVAFNASATLVAGLTSDGATLDGALSAIQTARQTCLVCAVDVAANELASVRHKATNTPVLILLTDGQSNPRPASEAVARAAQAKQAGVVIFTIGLGSDLDDAALAAIASQPSYFCRAPTADELHDIYRRIAVTIPCPPEQFWGRR